MSDEATKIRRFRGTISDLPDNELATDDSGIVKFKTPSGLLQAVDTVNTQTVAGNKTLSGTNTHSGTNTFSGTAAFTGATTGVRRAVSRDASDTRTLTAAESGLTIIATKASATQVFTLPAAATGGLQYTFVCGHASGEIHLAVASGDNIVGKTDGAADGTGLVSTVTTGLLKDTAAGNVIGDFVTVVSDGVTTWFMVAVAGGWTVT